MDLGARDKIVLVTGAGRGVGRAIALRFATHGATVAVNALHLTSAQRVAEEIREQSGKAIAVAADVSDETQVRHMVDAVVRELGGVHILVNNAGVLLEIAPIVDQSLDAWDRTMSVNIRGAYVCCREVGKWMVAQKMGNVVNITSINGIRGMPMRTAYCCSKAAMVSLTQGLAVEWAPYGINVNCVAPGPTSTELTKTLIEDGRADPGSLLARTPLGKYATPDDVANAVLFLASDLAQHITGAVVPVDGGWMASGY
ncbi:SDR family NAD(P)-dependent oxidoreductase [Chloroflexota bacterium]